MSERCEWDWPDEQRAPAVKNSLRPHSASIPTSRRLPRTRWWRVPTGVRPGLLVAIWILVGLGLRAAFAGQPVPNEGRGMEAIARIFGLVWGYGDQNILVNTTADPPWSEAILQEQGEEFYIKLRPETKCTYDIARAHPESPGSDEMTVNMDRPIASIAFDRLSDEFETRLTSGGHYPYYDLKVLGQPGAVCQTKNGRYSCYNQLAASLSLDKLRSMLRMLRFVFSNVCAPATLPFDR
jgi:hypothetical protein